MPVAALDAEFPCLCDCFKSGTAFAIPSEQVSNKLCKQRNGALMKTSTLLTAGLYILLLTRSVTVTAQDRRNSNYGAAMNSGYNGGMNRFLFGLPMPQQWSGVRPTAMSRGFNGQGYTPSGNSVNYANGQCQRGIGANGQCSGGRCVGGQCPTGACASGQCRTGACGNGQCGNGQPVSGQFSNGNYSSGYRGMSICPNGQCPQGAQSGGMSRSTRSMPADPFRRSGDLSANDQWTPRPVIAPLNDVNRGTGYDRNDLDLRSDYFGGESADGYDVPARTQSRSDFNSNEWTRPSRGSLEAPATTRSGIARF